MMLFGGFFSLLLLAGIVLAAVWLVPGRGWSGPPARSDRGDGGSPLEILGKRYARGEINRDEFERMKQDLSRD